MPVVLLHGFTGNRHSWEQLRPLLEPNFLFASLDIVGHGDSASPHDVAYYAIEYQAQNIVEFVKSVGYSDFHLLGYSMGGRLALYIATHFPDKVKSLILESASPGFKTVPEREVRLKADHELADKIEANGIEWFVDYWEKLPLWNSQTAKQKTYLREQRLKNDPVGLANSLRGMGTGVMPSLWDDLSTLQMPVKLIVGELDTKYVEINREMAELIPNVDLSIVAGAGHTLHLEKPDEYAELVLQFLDKHS